MDNSAGPEPSEGSTPSAAVSSTRSDRPRAATDPGRGRRIGIDVGTVRIGVASSDPDGILATPVETVPRAARGKANAGNRTGGRGAGGKAGHTIDLARIADIVREYEAVEVIVGLPRTLRGESGSSVALATKFAKDLQSLIPDVPIRLSDERLTTVAAARALRDSGVRARGQRQMIDQAAAMAILQGWLDERSAVLRSAGDAGGGVGM